MMDLEDLIVQQATTEKNCLGHEDSNGFALGSLVSRVASAEGHFQALEGSADVALIQNSGPKEERNDDLAQIHLTT